MRAWIQPFADTNEFLVSPNKKEIWPRTCGSFSTDCATSCEGFAQKRFDTTGRPACMFHGFKGVDPQRFPDQYHRTSHPQCSCRSVHCLLFAHFAQFLSAFGARGLRLDPGDEGRAGGPLSRRDFS